MNTETLLFKATTTTVDAEQGTFTAVISTASIDREGDIVEPQAVVDALHKWVPLAKKVPLSWNHSVDDGDIIGHIDPATAEAKSDEVHVNGWIDRSIPRGEGAWRLVKSGTLGFSYGYLIPTGGATKRAGGGRHIKAMDIYEITATPAPMNADTRVTGWKGIDKEAALSMALDVLTDGIEAEQAKRIDYEALFPADEAHGAASGELKTAWTAAYVNDLPDSAFLHERHFPVKDATGNADVPHLRNALTRIPQSNLPQSIKDSATAKARRMLDDENKAADEADMALKARSADPLRRSALSMALDVMTGGIEAPRVTKEPPKQVPEFDPDELRKRSRDLMLTVLTGFEVTNEPLRAADQGD
jgi:HK97 family phage prohead protease